jgi:Recombination endonuclease VII
MPIMTGNSLEIKTCSMCKDEFPAEEIDGGKCASCLKIYRENYRNTRKQEREGTLKEKICSLCKRLLPIEEFDWRKDNSSRLVKCKECYDPNGKKTCVSCGVRKDKTEFYITGKGTPTSYCHPCQTLALREWRYKKHYDLTISDYYLLFESQGWKCDICGKDGSDMAYTTSAGDFKVDHNHETNRVRGILCDRCNRGLGYFKDNPDWLRRAADYVEEGEQ